MTKSRKKPPKNQSRTQKLNIINPKAAGIDLRAREHWVCVECYEDKGAGGAGAAGEERGIDSLR